MSGYSAVIDPALQNLPPPKSSGIKRKARQAAPPTSLPPIGTRTRRAAAAAAASVPSPKDNEPARGEEENLMSYEYRETTKRSRRRSPSTHGQRGQASPAISQPHSEVHTPQQPITPAWAGSAHPSAHNSPGAGAGIDNLVAAAAYQSNPPPRYPYPYGLTPFRYPCLTPHIPQPPPGDESNPAFRRFDPKHGQHAPSNHHASKSVLPSAPISEHSNRGREQPPERTEHHTLAALLSATQAAEAGSLPGSIGGSRAGSRARTPDRR